MNKFVINHNEFCKLFFDAIKDIHFKIGIHAEPPIEHKNTKLPDEVTYTTSGKLNETFTIPAGTVFYRNSFGENRYETVTKDTTVNYAARIDFGSLTDFTKLDGTGFFSTCLTCDLKYTMTFNLVDIPDDMNREKGYYLFNINVSNIKTSEELVDLIASKAESSGYNWHWVQVWKDPDCPTGIVMFERREYATPFGDKNGIFEPKLPPETQPPDIHLNGILNLSDFEENYNNLKASKDLVLNDFKNFSNELNEIKILLEDFKKNSCPKLDKLKEDAEIYKNNMKAINKSLDEIIGVAKYKRKNIYTESLIMNIEPIRNKVFKYSVIRSNTKKRVINSIILTADGFFKGDYIDVFIGDKKIIDKLFIKAQSQKIKLGNLRAIYTKSEPLKLEYHNKSGLYKNISMEVEYYIQEGEIYEFDK